jgi:putative membrane protein
VVPFLITVLVLALSLWLISKLPLGIEIDNAWHALVGGAVIGILSSIGHLFPSWLHKASAILTLGLLPLISSVIVFGLAAWLVEGFRLRWGIWSAILGAIALSIVNSILGTILKTVLHI